MATAIIAILVFCALVFVHELGHFVAAKMLGVRVLEFSIGMGTLVTQVTKGETVYSLRAFPIGGYCKLEGEDEESTDDRAFNKKPAWARALILVAGSFMNIVTTIVILALIHTNAGIYSTVLDHVADGYPAYEAGLRQGDKIFSINEHPIRDWADVVESISESKNEYIVIGVLRDGAEVIVKSDTILNEEGRRVIGISPMLVHTPLLGIREAFRTTSYMMSAMGHFIVQLFSGKASSSDIVGPIGVVTIIGQQAKYGWLNVFHLMAMISLNLGIVNLLPFPALDGGRMLFVVIRGLSGGRISDELEATVHTIGMVLLLGLMVFLIFKDTMQFIL